MLRLLPVVLFCLFHDASSQQFSFPHAAVTDSSELSRAVPLLARDVLRRSAAGPTDLFRLEIVAGDDSAAIAGIASVRALFRQNDPQYGDLLYLQYELFSRARLRQAAAGGSFDEAFSRCFRDRFDRLDDRSAFHIATAFQTRNGLGELRENLRKTLTRLAGKDSLSLGDAIGLCNDYLVSQVMGEIEPPATALLKAEDARRYIIQDSVLIRTKDGATISTIVVRPRGAAGPLPAALTFNIYTEISLRMAMSAAAYGYVGVTAQTRGKGLSPDEIDTYEHVAEDAYGVIDWISRQPWSDGQVGMYGGSYSGFSQWAAAKHLHPALKTIVPYVANNPGNGLPMENNVFLFVNYAWTFYVTNNKGLDNATYSDRKRWDALNDRWYASGASYRKIDSIDGTPNKWFQRWLQHPDYDGYWQAMVPFKEEFAGINIPVLTITGYYDDGQQSALWYLKEHNRYNPHADHYLVIGPYDHFGAQSSRKDPVLRGYAIDSVAQFDTRELTFQWLDFVMRGGKKPALLQEKVNYEVMGANVWKHARSLDETHNDMLTLYLTDEKVGADHRLSPTKPSHPAFLRQRVDLADRRTSNNNDYYPAPIILDTLDRSSGFTFISEPFTEPVEVSGTFLGEIKARINKQDMDIGVALYEVMPNGKLFHLSYFIGRASYASDMSVRKLLTPGTLESIPFEQTRMVSRRLSKGSRLLVTLNVNKNPYAQINYGTGKDVSDEDINDASVPLRIEWTNESYVQVPIWR